MWFVVHLMYTYKCMHLIWHDIVLRNLSFIISNIFYKIFNHQFFHEWWGMHKRRKWGWKYVNWDGNVIAYDLISFNYSEVCGLEVSCCILLQILKLIWNNDLLAICSISMVFKIFLDFICLVHSAKSKICAPVN